jgi:hypothetical protein
MYHKYCGKFVVGQWIHENITWNLLFNFVPKELIYVKNNSSKYELQLSAALRPTSAACDGSRYCAMYGPRHWSIKMNETGIYFLMDIIFWSIIEVDTIMIVVETLKGKYKLTQQFINYKGTDWPFTNKMLHINFEIFILMFEQSECESYFFFLFLVFVNLVLRFSKQKWGSNEQTNTME